MTHGVDRRAMATLSAGHLFTDVAQGSVPALLLFLKVHDHLSYAAASALVLAATISSSVIQPVFGHLSDRISLPWLMPLGPFLGGLGVALAGLAPNYGLTFAAIVVSGIGVAAFHPEGSRFSNYFAGKRRASGMSWFTLGGYLGFAMGPLAVTPLILAFGLHGTAVLVLPALVVFALVWRELPRFEEARRVHHHAHRQRAGSDDWRGFSILTGVVALRSMTFLAAVTFMPIFAIRIAHANATLAAMTLAALLFGGAFGTVFGGRMADRVDRRRVVTISLALTALFALALAAAGTYVPQLPLTALLSIALGIALGLSAGVIVVMGQEYLPQRIGVASGVTLGLAVTIGGLAAPFFGWIGDRYGLIAVFTAVAFFALLSLAGSFFMPKPAGAQRA